MRTLLIAAPTDDAVSLDDVKRHLVVDHGEHDALIRSYMAAAVGQLDPAAGGWLGRALRTQTWSLQLDGFPCGAIELPFPPLQAVTEVAYTDAAGATVILASDTGYRVIFGTGAVAGKSSIAPPYGGSWPSARSDYASVRIKFRCGYALPASANDPDPLPGPVRAWLLVMIGTLYANRESIAAATAELPHVAGLLSTSRVY